MQFNTSAGVKWEIEFSEFSGYDTLTLGPSFTASFAGTTDQGVTVEEERHYPYRY
ncbi:MAG: hypothetical protein HRT54_05850 [Colwellia sp.]|nr:hypothetical protein [Colwellia sp.]